MASPQGPPPLFFNDDVFDVMFHLVVVSLVLADYAYRVTVHVNIYGVSAVDGHDEVVAHQVRRDRGAFNRDYDFIVTFVLPLVARLDA